MGVYFDMNRTRTLSKGPGTDLTEGPIPKKLLTFAVPIILANLIQQLYSMVDLLIIGQFVGSIGTVGVSTGGEISDLLSPVAMGFATGGQIYISQLIGGKDEQAVKRTVGTLLSFMLLISTILAVIVIAVSHPILRAINCPEQAMDSASSYLIITALGLPFIFGYNAVCGILRGMGESKRPLYFIIIAAVVNIGMDLIFVVIFPLEAAGTAIATVFSQFCSFLASFLFLLKDKERFGFERKLSSFKLFRAELRIIIRLGIPQVVRVLLVRFSMLWINSTANSYGMVVSETNSIGNKLQKLLDVFTLGIDTASAAMIGQNLGARKPDRAKQVTLCTLAVSLCCAAVISLLYLVCPKILFSIFTKNEEVILLGTIYLHILILHTIVSAVVGSFQSMVTGCGFVSFGFAIGILDGIVCKVGLSMLFVYVFDFGYVGLFWGTACSRILPAILCMWYFFSGKWKTRKLLTE